jgi:hypothetical protein
MSEVTQIGQYRLILRSQVKEKMTLNYSFMSMQEWVKRKRVVPVFRSFKKSDFDLRGDMEWLLRDEQVEYP